MRKALRKIRRTLFFWRKKKVGMRFKRKYRKFNIGEYTYGAPTIHEFGEQLTIGRYCSIGPGVQIFLGGNHDTAMVSTYPFSVKFKNKFGHLKGHPSSKGPIIIGNDVWIGAGAIIVSGVKIGDGAVVAAGSIVVKDIPPYAIAAGNPCAVKRYRFNDDSIKSLLESKWWEKDIDELSPYVKYLQSHDVNGFLNTFKN